jgi:Na+/H+ antiporter NhaD/arsenite permease-like protein
MMKQMIKFFQRETVLCIAVLLAFFSAFFVTPDAEYMTYIDYRTLAILFCLMTVMAGYSEIGIFNRLATGLLSHIRQMRDIVLILVLLCFGCSMFITNDVALITFVPLTMVVLKFLGSEYQKRWMIPLVVMQTIAANLGSMLTPIGNPQNLYLYEQSGIPFKNFLLLMLPYSLTALLCLLVWIFAACFREREALSVEFPENSRPLPRKPFVIYTVLFLLCLLTVAKIISYLITLCVVIVLVLITDCKILKKVDFCLLFTFAGFFIFIGNMGRLEIFRRLIQSMLTGRETVTAILLSQIISNVPAALLLSGFTDCYEKIMIGVNLGGLGTLIASMASLISFKYIAKEDKNCKARYLLYFTAANVLFLIPELLIYTLLH